MSVITQINNPIRTQCECGGNLIRNNHEITCRECGIVHSSFRMQVDYLDTIAVYNPSVASTHGSTLSLKNLRKPLEPETKRIMVRCEIIEKREDKTYDNVTRILIMHDLICQQMQLSNIIREEASHHYLKLTKNVSIPNRVSAIATCTYFAMRTHKSTQTISDLVRFYQENGHHITERLIIRSGLLYSKFLQRSAPKTASDYITSFIHALIEKTQSGAESDITLQEKATALLENANQIESKARKLLSKLNDQIGGRNPKNLAGAVLYCIIKLMNIEIRQCDVANAIDIKEYSLRSIFGKLVKPLIPKLGGVA